MLRLFSVPMTIISGVLAYLQLAVALSVTNGGATGLALVAPWCSFGLCLSFTLFWLTATIWND
jgi:hypothetical protein